MTENVTLKRSISLPLITLYGIGTILGAGIYVVISKIAVQSGMYAPFSFLLSAVIVGFSAASYAELSARFPRSAGEAFYVNTAFSKPWLAALVGWAILATGIVSAAAICNGFVGYLQLFVDLPHTPLLVMTVIVLAGIASWGVAESVSIAAVITVIEIIGLLLVIGVSGESLATLPDRLDELIPPFSMDVWLNISFGAFLAFYAYVGFEDMVNMAEEVKDPERNMPKSIFWALILSTILYVVVAVVAVLSLPLEQLTATKAPFADIIKQNSSVPVSIIGGISLIAIINGALVQIIMGARVMYGMAAQGLAPHALAKVNSKTQTPVHATLGVSLVVMVLALWFPLSTLAQITSFIILCVFSLVNLALFKIKWTERQQPQANEGAIQSISIHWCIPIIGSALCIAFILIQFLR